MVLRLSPLRVLRLSLSWFYDCPPLFGHHRYWNFIWIGILSDLCPELEFYLETDANWNFIGVGILSDLCSQLEFYLDWNFI